MTEKEAFTVITYVRRLLLSVVQAEHRGLSIFKEAIEVLPEEEITKENMLLLLDTVVQARAHSNNVIMQQNETHCAELEAQFVEVRH